MKANNKRRNFYFFLSIFLTNLSTTITIHAIHELKIKNSTSYLDIPYIENNDDCKKWIPSLFNPISLVPKYVDLPNNVSISLNDEISIPIIANGESMFIFYLNFTFLDKYNILASKEKSFTNFVNKCYFGLLNTKGDYPNLIESLITLEQLRQEKKIDKKIFSFDKWNINEDNTINSTFYYGDLHNNFNSKKKYIGNCKADKVGKYWGCFFNEISINDTIIDLKKNDDEYYPIYFTSESFNITFPQAFKDKFENRTKNLCEYREDKDKREPKFSCNNNIFINEEVALLKLIDNDTIITTEIDNLYRFNHSNKEGKNMTRIKYDKIEYFIFPLIMFKNFHIQFDAEKNLISFYTTNRTILTLKNIKDDDDDEGSSNGLIIFLIIIIILIVIAIGFGIFWFFKRRRGSLENNINKYNKFEDEENFQSMNEQRVF